MNKRLVLLSCFLLVSVAAYAQYPYKWQIGGTLGGKWMRRKENANQLQSGCHAMLLS